MNHWRVDRFIDDLLRSIISICVYIEVSLSCVVQWISLGEKICLMSVLFILVLSSSCIQLCLYFFGKVNLYIYFL
jgi:hypothetical protein